MYLSVKCVYFALNQDGSIIPDRQASFIKKLNKGRDPAKWEVRYSRLSGFKGGSGVPFLELLHLAISTHAVILLARDG